MRENTEMPQSRPPRSIFTSFALRSLKSNRTHTTVSIIGIALSCALITAIFTSVATLYSGLLSAELRSEGSWQMSISSSVAGEQAAVAKDERVEDAYVLDTYGAALMPQSFEGYWGRYLTVQAWPTPELAHGLAPLPRIVKGRAPSAPGEIALGRDLEGATVENGQWLYDKLPSSGQDDDVPRAYWSDCIAIGTEIDLALGQRVVAGEGRPRKLQADASLYTEAGENGDAIKEWLDDAGPLESYTVVGFYDGQGEYLPSIWSNNAGYLGFVAAGSHDARSSDTLITTNLTTRSQIDELAREYSDAPHPLSNVGAISETWTYGDTLVEVHDALLRYQGITDDSAIWNTLYSIAGILSCVVACASVSLIYNSFAISVTERTRQFGLLASLGASRRQLRHTVYIEAALLAAAGIPAGLALGLIGTRAVFQVAGEGVGMLIDQVAFGSEGVTGIVVSPIILGVSAALSLATVLVSAAIPAIRASRIPAIDAIRQSNDIRLDQRGLKRRSSLQKALDAMRLRLTGVSGLVAHRNLTRARSKAHVAVASLGISVALIIISGSISHYLGFLTQVTERAGSDIEVYLDRVLAQDETISNAVDKIDAAYRELDAVNGAHGEGYILSIPLFGSFEPGMVDPSALGGGEDPDRLPIDDKGTTYTTISILFVDEASWKKMLEHDGLDQSRYCDPARPLAIGLNGTQSIDGTRHIVLNSFERTGTATLFTQIADRGRDFLSSIEVDALAGPQAVYELYQQANEIEVDEQGNLVNEVALVPLNQALLKTLELPVGAIVDDPPRTIRDYAPASPTLVLPVSALSAISEGSEGLKTSPHANPMSAPFAFHTQPGSYDHSMTAFLSFAIDEPRPVESGMREILQGDLSGSEWHRSWLNNNAAEARSGRIMRDTINLFINCFIAITGAIAVANVFNTLASSIALRRREFAMLRSIGMDERAFRRMIALECLSYAWRGLALGLLIGSGVTYLVYRSMGYAFEGIAFGLPPAWVLGAVGVVAAVLTLSTIYALRKTHADSIVATLREDSI